MSCGNMGKNALEFANCTRVALIQQHLNQLILYYTKTIYCNKKYG